MILFVIVDLGTVVRRATEGRTRLLEDGAKDDTVHALIARNATQIFKMIVFIIIRYYSKAR